MESSNKQQYAYGFNPTEDHLNKLQELQKLTASFPLSKEQYREKFTKSKDLQRLLIAREYNPTKSFEMWKKWVDWRLQYKVDELNPAEFLADLKSGKAFFHKQRRPFVLNSTGNQIAQLLVFQTRKHIPKETSVKEMMKFGAYIIEEGTQILDQRLEGNGQMVCVWDRAGQTTKNFDKRMFTVMKSLVNVLQDNYAERLHTVFVLNPNWFFKMMYAIVSPFLSKRTKDKYKLIKNIKELQQYFDDDCLLKEHGGTSDFIYEYQLPEDCPEQVKGLKQEEEEVEEQDELNPEENKFIDEQLQQLQQAENEEENQQF